MTDEQKERKYKFREEQAREIKRDCTFPICEGCGFLTQYPRLLGCKIDNPSHWKI